MYPINNVSKVKQELVLQVITLWEKLEGDKAKFDKEMKDLGWSTNVVHSHGSFKKCFWKGSIVAKYANNDYEPNLAEVKREYEQFHSVPKHLQKYFPRVYAFVNGLLIQDRVLLKCGELQNLNPPQKCTLSEVYKEFDHRLDDYGHNHGHSKAGTVKFFDWVYKRRNPWLGKLHMPLYEET